MKVKSEIKDKQIRIRTTEETRQICKKWPEIHNNMSDFINSAIINYDEYLTKRFKK